MEPQTRTLWKSLRESDCRRCGLHEEAQYVCLLGDGPTPARIIGVGEAPGLREEQKEKPFQGNAGQYLDSVLEGVGLSRADIYLTNAVKCRPLGNRTPTDKEIKACRYYLGQELITHEPKWVLILGASALKSVLGMAGVMKQHGSLVKKAGVSYFISIHPSACLHNPSNRPLFEKDMKTFAALVRGKLERPKTRTRLVRGLAGLLRMLKALAAAKTFAYDLEWWGEPWDEGGITCLGFSSKPGEAWACLLDHPEAQWKDWRKILKRFKPLLLDPKKKKIAHNGRADNAWLRAYGIPMQHTFDTIVAAHLLDENRFMSLESLSRTLLQAPEYKAQADVSLGRDLPGKILAQRNGKDCDYTLRLGRLFKKQLEAEPRLKRLFELLAMPMTDVLTDVELEGMVLDRKKLKDARRINETHRKDLIRALRQYVPRPWKDLEVREAARTKGFRVNFNSTQWVGQWLFGPTVKELDRAIKHTSSKAKIRELQGQKKRPGLGLLNSSRTKTGRFATDEDTLLYLPGKQHPAIRLLLDYRLAEKYRSTYIDPWADRVSPDGRIHISYNQTGTVTGRMSSDIHTTPRDPFIRAIWGCPPGWKLGQADYSQVEMRLGADASQDRTMLRMFAEGRDPHTETAQDLLNLVEVTPEERKKAKAFNFGFLFGMYEKKFQASAREKYALDFSLAESKRYRTRWMRRYPGIPDWHARQRRLVRRYQQVLNRIGRRRLLPDALSPDGGARGEAERQSINSPIQSLANDLTMLAGVLAKANNATILALAEGAQARFSHSVFRIIGFVHDAMLFYIKVGHEEEVLPELKKLMENLPLEHFFGTLLTVPIEVEIKVGTHWGEGSVWQPSKTV